MSVVRVVAGLLVSPLTYKAIYLWANSHDYGEIGELVFDEAGGPMTETQVQTLISWFTLSRTRDTAAITLAAYRAARRPEWLPLQDPIEYHEDNTCVLTKAGCVLTETL